MLSVRPVNSLADVVAVEQVPIEDRGLPNSTYQLLQDAARLYGERIAISYLMTGSCDEKSVDISYRELFHRVTQTANALHRLGIESRDVVSTLLPNLPHSHYAIWGGEAAGIVNPINPHIAIDQVVAIMNSVKSKVLITLAPYPGSDLWQKALEIKKRVYSLRAILIVDPVNLLPLPRRAMVSIRRKLPRMQGVYDFDKALSRCPADMLESHRQIQPQEIAAYFYTGGATGTPKITPHSHRNEAAMALMLNCMLRFQQGQVILSGLSLSHANALIIAGLAPFMAGARVLLPGMEGYRGEQVLQRLWALIDHYRVEVINGVPAFYKRALSVPVGSHRLDRVRFALCGASPLPTKLIEQFQQHCGIPLVEGYGLTEGTCVSSLNPPGEVRAGSIGIRMPYSGMKAVILDENQRYLRDCAVDEIGHILIRGPHVFPGYIQREKNHDVWIGDNGWFDTGDLGHCDAQGYYWLHGRSQDQISQPGHLRDPRPIEHRLLQFPGVMQAAVVGRNDAQGEHQIVAYVSAQAGADLSLEELSDAYHSEAEPPLPPLPRIYRLERLPLTSVGKVDRQVLRKDALCRLYQELLEDLRGATEIRVDIITNDQLEQVARIQGLPDDAPLQEQVNDRLKGLPIRAELV
ncbi:acyl-CoA synthetase [Aestuariirhabdus litorea]|uniref:Acyl-CoA synthetase n=1 Tax=Aestuariirhabdus litorea TaxID=2528527 RepID=A0A3P3VLY9_9GAMM|nr:acyl-CoA synthetase [Aestuariirhabdus litorea]RRJ83444.1 acyl-CoA synthetase [Aestuariirhabdus litorea]RWW93606.1 acyl-CoA synthetase [Endozoicomonadaceae bacterium GTF-13]